MSTYENYEDAAQFFDNGRVPAGSEIYCTLLQGYLKKPFKEIHLLDAGCGTGNYSKAFLDAGIGKVTAIDASPGMLSKAKTKLQSYVEKGTLVDLTCCHLPDVPFSDSAFDAVTFIEVLHHLDKPFEGFPNLKKCITEAFRVLKPGGVLLIDFATHDQLRYGLWYRNLLPRTVERTCDNYMPQEEMLLFLQEVGFQNASTIVCPWETILVPEIYFNKDGPFQEEWRRLDSVWRLAEDEGELETALKSLREKKEFGILEDWFEQIERKRQQVGTKTGLFVQKPVK